MHVQWCKKLFRRLWYHETYALMHILVFELYLHIHSFIMYISVWVTYVKQIDHATSSIMHDVRVYRKKSGINEDVDKYTQGYFIKSF